MKRIFLSSVMLLMAVMVMASPVSQEKTQQIANFFFHEKGGLGDLHLVENSTYGHLHIYSGENSQGFVIMSSDDCVLPVLGYSVSNRFDINNMGANTQAWLEDYDNQIEWNIRNAIEISSEVSAAWSALSKMMPLPQQAPATVSTFNTANLLTTTWAQYPYYNSQCPYDSQEGEYTLTGCVATAMAQIMKYWGYPLRGRGSYTYTDPDYGTQSANFADTVFNYAIMPNSLSSSSSAAQVNAVALLMRRCGIAAEMYYGVEASGATTCGKGKVGFQSAENAYREYFKFMHTAHSVAITDYTTAGWIALMKNEIDNGRPVQYSAGNVTTGGGHSFIICGYDNSNLLYINWGWGGSNDGCYQVGYLNPGARQYNLRNKAIIGIEPDTTDAAQTTITLVANPQGAGSCSGAGTYSSYEDTAKIVATATSGYLFSNWNGSMTYEPYEFLPNGGSVTHTANFEKMQGDTLGYCFDANVSAYGGSSSATRLWAIKLDSNSIAPGKMLVKVSAFISEEGNYKVHIYQGATANLSTKVLSDTLNIPSSQDESWVEITLSQSVVVDRTKPLWIALETTGTGYPRSYSAYRGNPDGAWVASSANGGWINYVTAYGYYLAFQIRGIFQDNPGPFSVTVVPNDAAMGSVTGGGMFSRNVTTTITATANAGYHFVDWNDGDTNSVRQVTVTDNVTYTANFAANQYEVTVTSDDATMGSVSGTGTYSYGSTITITATANSGYKFKQWQDGNTDAGRQVVVSGDMDFTAYFEESPSGVENVRESQISAYSHGDNIIVENVASREIKIYDLTGKIVASKKAVNDREVFRAVAGVYFVRVDGKTQKVVVR